MTTHVKHHVSTQARPSIPNHQKTDTTNHVNPHNVSRVTKPLPNTNNKTPAKVSGQHLLNTLMKGDINASFIEVRKIFNGQVTQKKTRYLSPALKATINKTQGQAGQPVTQQQIRGHLQQQARTNNVDAKQLLEESRHKTVPQSSPKKQNPIERAHKAYQKVEEPSRNFRRGWVALKNTNSMIGWASNPDTRKEAAKALKDKNAWRIDLPKRLDMWEDRQRLKAAHGTSHSINSAAKNESYFQKVAKQAQGNSYITRAATVAKSKFVGLVTNIAEHPVGGKIVTGIKSASKSKIAQQLGPVGKGMGKWAGNAAKGAWTNGNKFLNTAKPMAKLNMAVTWINAGASGVDLANKASQGKQGGHKIAAAAVAGVGGVSTAIGSGMITTVTSNVGAAAGAALGGAVAGPPGIWVGSLIGRAAGLGIGLWVSDRVKHQADKAVLHVAKQM
jgi:hypothetical protein